MSGSQYRRTGSVNLPDPRAALSATFLATTGLVCCGTFWEFRPPVERNAYIAWKLLQAGRAAALVEEG